MNPYITSVLQEVGAGKSHVTILTGAGISAESGIPTFRGPEGYWTIGSREYHPQEMATLQMFQQKPHEVWQWYLYRLGVCRQAPPNAGHLALVKLEKRLKTQFTLITQNVDSLHLRAGSTPERTFQIHGNVFFMRCTQECSSTIFPIPEILHHKKKTDKLTAEVLNLLHCPNCGSMTRPHVLWFDETYDEEHFRYASSLAVAEQTDLLIIVGTSGATNLPNQIAHTVFRQKKPIIDINIEKNPFSELAMNSNGGGFIQEPSASALPQIVNIISGESHPE
jgi:NAD-dependent deacetylase